MTLDEMEKDGSVNCVKCLTLCRGPRGFILIGRGLSRSCIQRGFGCNRGEDLQEEIEENYNRK